MGRTTTKKPAGRPSGSAPAAPDPSTAVGPTARKKSISPAEIAEREQRKKETDEAVAKFGRGEKVQTGRIRDRKQKAHLKRLEDKYRTTAIRVKDSEVLLENDAGAIEAEHELERTYRVTQADIAAAVPVETASKRFSLKLDTYGPYEFSYSRNGRDLLLAGRKGHVATMDWRAGKPGCELHLNETVRDAVWLHNNQYFAVAQKKYVYIYDHQGVELHKLDKHIEVTHMEFLPYHFLLATVGNAGFLKYQDTSTGQVVCELPTKQGPAGAMAQNPANAVVHLGHQNGQISLWTPNAAEPAAKLLAHRGPVGAIAIDRTGNYMVSTGGVDRRMAVWDIRMMRELNNYYLRRPARSVAISDRGMTAVAWGSQATVWKGLFAAPSAVPADDGAAAPNKVQSPYMNWVGPTQLERVRWCPFEDILGASHHGIDSLIIPGAGEANFDAGEVNPFESAEQRRAGEVRALLDKLQPGMISLDQDFVGRLNAGPGGKAAAAADRTSGSSTGGRKNMVQLLDEQVGPKRSVAAEVEEMRNRGRGRNSALRKYLRKKGNRNVVDEKRVRVEAAIEAAKQKNKEKTAQQKEQYGPALERFAR